MEKPEPSEWIFTSPESISEQILIERAALDTNTEI
jgi:hypothetical protein